MCFRRATLIGGAACALAAAIVVAAAPAALAVRARAPAGATSCPAPAGFTLALDGAPVLWGPDHNGNWHVNGVVTNNGPGAAADAYARYTVRDASGTAIVTDTRYVQAQVLAPGKSSGFDAPLFRPARTPASVTVTGTAALTPTTVASHPFPVTVDQEQHQSGAQFGVLAGTVRNDLDVPLFSIEVAATLRDAAGHVVAVVQETTEDDFGGLDPGASRPWRLGLDPALPAWTSYTIESTSDTPTTPLPLPSACVAPLPRTLAKAPVGSALPALAAAPASTAAPSMPTGTPSVARPSHRRATTAAQPAPSVAAQAPAAATRVSTGNGGRGGIVAFALGLALVVGFATSAAAAYASARSRTDGA